MTESNMPSNDIIGAGAPGNSTEKDPDNWVTGDEPMTGAQRSYLETLAREAGEEVREGLTKAQASEEIERLQRVTGRGAPADDQASTEATLPTELGGADS